MITRLGFCGPSAAYPGFAPKTEAAVGVSTGTLYPQTQIIILS